jgi:DNA primase
LTGIELPIGAVPYVGDWRGIKPETYRKFEAFQHHRPEFIGRIVFPIKNLLGRVSALIGRHTTGEIPKYLVHPYGAKLPLYPLVKPIEGTIILVEGIFDMLNLQDKGLTNTVCCFGTKNINTKKLENLKIQGVQKLIIFFDGDAAGKEGAVEVQKLCTNSLSQNEVDKLKRKLYNG